MILNDFKKIIILSVVNIILTIILIFLFNQYPFQIEKRIFDKQREMQSTQGIAKDVVYEETSPDGNRKIILYKILDNPKEQGFIALKDKISKIENYIYFSDYRDDMPYWIGNDFVYFTTYCGTSCQRLFLLNVDSKQIYHGVLSYMVLDEKRGPYTIFKDWFGHEFNFNGLVDEIRSDTIGDKVYLIFYMRDDKSKSIGQKKFLFTGKTLEEL